MASPGSLAYPDRFYAAAAYAGFGAASPSASAALSRFQNDVALLLYGLYQQVTDLVGLPLRASLATGFRGW
jgi:hypothetical protein